MGRADRRRQEKEANKKPKMYHLTDVQIKAIKDKAVSEAIDTAFILMLGLPTMVIHDKFTKIWRKEGREETFVDEILELYDTFNKGYLTLDDVITTLKEETGIDILKKR